MSKPHTKHSPRFIFITGGVASSLGKGIATASLAALLQARGYSVRMRKLDPYLNVDPGTMNPWQHGEVFITQDGAETDLDLGHYERFTSIHTTSDDSITSGKIYLKLLNKERNGEYLGNTVQVIPHMTNLIKEFIITHTQDVDFVLCEIGGTVGDIESLPYLEAIRQLGYELNDNRVIYIHVTLIPYLSASQELKTKPTQHSVKELRAIGIQPNVLLCRSERAISQDERNKIALFCNVDGRAVIEALDQDSIYKIPLSYHKEGLDETVLDLLGIQHSKPDLTRWQEIVHKIDNPTSSIEITIVGKYNKMADAYKSLVESFTHAGIYYNCKIVLSWVDAEELNENNITALSKAQGIVVPGGFGIRGVEGKVCAIRYARENGIPFFGICLGMQLSIIEFARNKAGILDANSSEFSKNATYVIDIMQQSNKVLGGSMRLGEYNCSLSKGSLAESIYGSTTIRERHRHRFEFNGVYRSILEQAGMRFSGWADDSQLIEVIELPDHPFFIAVQFHPEFSSTPFLPHPLFKAFTKRIMLNKGIINEDQYD